MALSKPPLVTARAVPPPVASPLGELARDFLIQRAALIASVRDVRQTTDGITSGPGNQGTANTAMPVLHAGTGMDQLSVPRGLSNGRQQSV